MFAIAYCKRKYYNVQFLLIDNDMAVIIMIMTEKWMVLKLDIRYKYASLSRLKKSQETTAIFRKWYSKIIIFSDLIIICVVHFNFKGTFERRKKKYVAKDSNMSTD